MKHICLITVFFGILSLWPATSAIAGIVNPGFTEGDDGLDGWIHNELVISWDPSGSVLFSPDEERLNRDSFLRQVFTLDPGSSTISFDGVISVPSETGIFTAGLFSPGTTTSLVGDVDGQGHFFSISSEEILPDNDHLDFTFSLDVSGLSGQEVELIFNLNNDYPIDTENDSYVILSNLNLTVIPEPAIMSLLGIGALSMLRRKK